MITSIGNRYNKASTATDSEVSTNYDEIDDEIPIAISKQALKTIQTSEIVKQEIIEHNQKTASLASSFIGRMWRRSDDVVNDAPDGHIAVPSKKCRSSIVSKRNSKDNVAVTPSKSFSADPVKLLQRIQNKFSSNKAPQSKEVQPVSDEEFEEGEHSDGGTQNLKRHSSQVFHY